MGGPKVREGSALRPSQGVNYQALPSTRGNPTDRDDVGERAWSTRRERRRAPAFPVQVGASLVFFFCYYPAGFVSLGKEPNRRCSPQVIGAKIKEGAGNQPQAIHFFLSPAFPS